MHIFLIGFDFRFLTNKSRIQRNFSWLLEFIRLGSSVTLSLIEISC